MHRLLNIWEFLRTSLWFVPLIMIVAGIVLAMLALQLETAMPEKIGRWLWWLRTGDHESARNMMSVLASSMIAMTALVISVTMVVLTLAANHFGSRIVRNFMRDLMTQLVLGTFVMTIVYSLFVLRSIETAEVHPVPSIAVTVGTLLVLISILALLLFIHNLSRSIVADSVVLRVAADLDESIERLLPDSEAPRDGEADTRQARRELPDDFFDTAAKIDLQCEGYVQAIDYEQLVQLAEARSLRIHINFRPGHFLTAGISRISVAPSERIDTAFKTQLQQAILVGDSRTPTQDIEFSIRHLVEIAVRAMSPGINDPFTAMSVIDRLGASLAKLMRKRLQSSVFTDDSDVVRVAAKDNSYAGLIDAVFHQIRQACAGKPAVLIHMLDTIATLGLVAFRPDQREALRLQAEMILRAGQVEPTDPEDRAEIDRRYKLAVKALTQDWPEFEKHLSAGG